MKRIIINVVIILQVLFLTSCLTTKQTNLLQEPGLGIPSYPKVNTPVEEYRVKIGDQLTIVVTTNPMDILTSQLFSYFSARSMASNATGDALRGFPIKTDGTIYFPYLGDIYVRGKTILEIQQLIEQRINESISDDCIVRVFLENRYYSVIGESMAGRFPIVKEQMTIYQALAQCKDVNPYGDRKQVKIVRQVDGATVIKVFDIRSKDIVNSEFYYVQPNDVIYIQPLGRQFLGLSSFGAVFAVVSTVVSLGLMIYNLVK